MKLAGREFNWGERTFVMGVVNVTPDSFSGDGTISHDSDEGQWVSSAVEQARRMVGEGADIIDVGGESTRPPAVYEDAKPVDAEDERRRVLPVIERIVQELDVPVSIDTRKASVAEAAVEAGASLINDISMLGDPDMASAAESCGVPMVISHIREKARYRDPVGDVATDLENAVATAVKSGVERSQIIIDPGIGFGKTASHSLTVLRGLRAIKEQLDLPVLVGTSRKSFIGAVLDLRVDDRIEGTAATIALAVASGADIVRVHDVRAMARVARMSDAVVRGWAPDVSQ